MFMHIKTGNLPFCKSWGMFLYVDDQGQRQAQHTWLKHTVGTVPSSWGKNITHDWKIHDTVGNVPSSRGKTLQTTETYSGYCSIRARGKNIPCNWNIQCALFHDQEVKAFHTTETYSGHRSIKVPTKTFHITETYSGHCSIRVPAKTFHTNGTYSWHCSIRVPTKNIPHNWNMQWALFHQG